MCFPERSVYGGPNDFLLTCKAGLTFYQFQSGYTDNTSIYQKIYCGETK